MPRPIILLFLSVVLGITAWTVHEPDADARLQKEAIHLQRTLDQRAQRLAQGSERWMQALAELGTNEWMRRHARSLEAERLTNGTVYLGFINDSLVCWSGQLPADVSLVLKDSTPAQRVLPDAIYQHAETAVGSLHLHALSPVWNTPAIENKYVSRGFHDALDTPDGLMAQPSSASGPLITDAQGAPLLRVAWRDGALDVGPWIILKLVLMLAAAGLLVVASTTACSRIARNGDRWVAIVAFVASLFLLRALVLFFIPSAPFDRLPLFDPATYAASFAFPSLGDLVINAAMLLIAALFIRRTLHDATVLTPLWLVPFIWAALLASAAWVTHTIIGLVNDSSVDLDLYHVQSLNGASVAAVFGIALLFIAWSLFAETCMTHSMRQQRPWAPWALGAVVLVISIVLHHRYSVLDTVLFLWPLPLLILFYFVGRDGFRFVHALLGLGVLAAVTSHVLTKYTRDREQRERSVLAERLSVREDPVVETLFREVAPRLRSDAVLHGLITSTKPCAAGDLDAAVRQVFFGSFWERYDVRVFAFDAAGVPRCRTEGDVPRSLEKRTSGFADHTALADMPDLFFEQRGTEGSFYHARLVVMPNESAVPGQLIIELHPRSAAQGLGFPELLLSGEDPIGRRTERYAIARYERGVLVDRSNTRGVPLRWTRNLGPEGMLWYTDAGMEYLARGSVNGTLLVLGTPVPNLVDKATTFSYLFALFSVLLALSALVRMLVRFRGIPPLGIAGKVRTALLLFAVIGLFFFGAGAQRLLTRQYTQRSETTILEKARSAHAELQQKLDGRPPLQHDGSRYLEHVLAQLSNVLFTDITLFDTHGCMLASSRPQVFSNGLLGPRMDAVAYARMAVDKASDFVHQESIGLAHYQSAYLPLRDRRGTVLGYLSLPSFADQRQQEQERSGVLVAVVNLFVLLFALSVLVALFISNWTVRPLDLLKRSLSSVDLQGDNKPLSYRGNDEVGQLVEVYNRKVDELRENAEKLARSERESAWKEMARQVAHEIKNPLTPMKLGIQHFQHTWDPNAVDAKERLDRFTNSMVEQIDVLSRVAGDFSRFAQLSAAKETTLDVNEVARSVVALFAGEETATISLNTAPPLLVKADREHLVRVLNNLIKNALQAIPEGRHGSVDVVLKQSGANAVIEVRDNGSGIAEADRERIFTPSFTTKSSGTGLGLAMVKRMVEQAGGTVWFETREGEGTSFFVSLPLHP
jgi:signal transduction histidine kinase